MGQNGISGIRYGKRRALLGYAGMANTAAASIGEQMSDLTCPAGTHRVDTASAAYCVEDAHAVPVADTLSLTGLALAILWVVAFRRRA